MTLKNFIDLITNPYEIPTIYALDNDSDVIAQFGYCKEETVEEYCDYWRNCKYPPDEEELILYCEEYRNYRSHLNSEIIEIKLSNGDSEGYIYVKYNEECEEA